MALISTNGILALILGQRARRTRIGRRWIVLVALLVLGAVLVSIASLPSNTEMLVDFEPVTITQPLYVKAIAFVDRDMQMRELTARIIEGARSDDERAERILLWTAANVRPTPPGMPIVDDHPYNVMIRGYGQTDQAADVFATLAAYAGMPGGLTYSVRPDGRHHYAFAVLRVDGYDAVFDVREGRSLRRADGRLASVAELRADPSMVSALPPPAGANGVPYSTLIERLDPGPHRRATQHMVLWRLLDALGRVFRW